MRLNRERNGRAASPPFWGEMCVSIRERSGQREGEKREGGVCEHLVSPQTSTGALLCWREANGEPDWSWKLAADAPAQVGSSHPSLFNVLLIVHTQLGHWVRLRDDPGGSVSHHQQYIFFFKSSGFFGDPRASSPAFVPPMILSCESHPRGRLVSFLATVQLLQLILMFMLKPSRSCPVTGRLRVGLRRNVRFLRAHNRRAFFPH